MTKQEVIRKYKQYLFPSVSTYYSEPLVTDHASMQYLWDVDGKKYLDFFGGIVTISVGHANPRITSKIKAQIDRLQHASTLFPNEAIVALAEKIARLTPGEISQSMFTNSGTEANETAIQLARAHSGNFEIVALRHGYSGRSQLAQSLTAHNTWRQSLPGGFGVVHAMNPYCYRCPLGKTYPDCGVACANDVEAVIQTCTSGRIAGFIAEPIQGVGGFITPPPEYFKMVFKTVKQYGGDFIADEVQTGCSWETAPCAGCAGWLAERHHRDRCDPLIDCQILQIAAIIPPCPLGKRAGRGAVRLARLHGVQEVPGSIPGAPTKKTLRYVEFFDSRPGFPHLGTVAFPGAPTKKTLRYVEFFDSRPGFPHLGTVAFPGAPTQKTPRNAEFFDSRPGFPHLGTVAFPGAPTQKTPRNAEFFDSRPGFPHLGAVAFPGAPTKKTLRNAEFFDSRPGFPHLGTVAFPGAPTQETPLRWGLLIPRPGFPHSGT